MRPLVLLVVSSTVFAQQPVPQSLGPLDAELVELGKTLFFEPRLSSTGEVSCASCHDLAAGGVDGLAVSRGVAGRRGTRNAPTVWNAALRTALFWDGRAASLEAQAGGPILNPDEMGMPDEAAVVARLGALEGYRDAFARAFGDGDVTFARVVAALAAFERTLLTPGSPFDRWVGGDEQALTPAAKRGWLAFNRLACIACHGEPTFSSRDVFVRFPVRAVTDTPYVLGATRDRGRGELTGLARDDNTWRVPSLRNVALTAPYLHNGSVAKLEQVVRLMGRAQLATTLSDEDVADLVAFLESLSGPLQGEQRP